MYRFFDKNWFRTFIAASALGLALLTGCASMGRYSPLRPIENRIVFQPLRYPYGDYEPGRLAVENAWIVSDDSTKLHGWFLDHSNPVAVALYLHGTGGNISTEREYLRTLNERHRVAVLAIDYRGYGRSEGSPSEDGILADARAARGWLASRTGIEESEVVLIGVSLGGAVAIDLAAKDGARGLVVSRTFTSLPDIGTRYAAWMLPKINMSIRFDSLSKIKQYQGPVFISHGDADELVPINQGLKLFAEAPGQKEFVTENGVDHNGSFTNDYHDRLNIFLTSLPKMQNSKR